MLKTKLLVPVVFAAAIAISACGSGSAKTITAAATTAQGEEKTTEAQEEKTTEAKEEKKDDQKEEKTTEAAEETTPAAEESTQK